MTVRFHRLAAREYRAARAWYEQRRLGLGAEFAAQVDRAVARIVSQPDRWPVFRGPFRRVRIRRFPYALYYCVDPPDAILILAVAHAKRRQGYWLRRFGRP